MKRFVRLLIPLFILIPIPALAAAPFCDAILQNGIYDRMRVLDLDSRYELAHWAYCQSDASQKSHEAGAGIAEVFTGSYKDSEVKSRQFCATNTRNYWRNQEYLAAVETINSAVVSAWETCTKLNAAGLSHYVQPEQDPEGGTFFYKIVFTPDGNISSSEIENFTIKNATCDREIKAGMEVDSGGILLSCERDDKDRVVTISVDATLGTRNIRGITLKPHKSYVVQSCDEEAYAWLPASREGGPDVVKQLTVCYPKETEGVRVVPYMRNTRSANDPFRPCSNAAETGQECPISWSWAKEVGRDHKNGNQCVTWEFHQYLAHGAREAELRVEGCRMKVEE